MQDRTLHSRWAAVLFSFGMCLLLGCSGSHSTTAGAGAALGGGSGGFEGGDDTLSYLNAAQVSLFAALTQLQNNPDPTVCNAPPTSATGNDPILVEIANAMTDAQRAYCLDFITNVLATLPSQYNPSQPTPFQLSYSPLFVDDGGLVLQVVAMTQPGMQDAIEFDANELATYSTQRVEATLAHEFGHKLFFPDYGGKITDYPPAGPFTGQEGGRHLLDAAGTMVAFYTTSLAASGTPSPSPAATTSPLPTPTPTATPTPTSTPTATPTPTVTPSPTPIAGPTPGPEPLSDQYPDGGVSTGWLNMTGNILLLHMNEPNASNGSTILDTSGLANNGVLTTNEGTASKSVTGVMGGALSFNGLDDYITAGTQGAPTGNQARTIAAWIKPMGTGGTIVDLQSSGGQSFMLTMQEQGGVWYLFTLGLDQSSNDNVTITASAVPGVGQWSHVAFTYDGVDNWNYYLNGNLASQGGFSVPINTGSIDAIVIGDRLDVAGDAFDGDIDEVAIWTRALSASEIWNAYEMQSGTPYSPPTASGLPNLGGNYTDNSGHQITVQQSGTSLTFVYGGTTATGVLTSVSKIQGAGSLSGETGLVNSSGNLTWIDWVVTATGAHDDTWNLTN